ncbi:hypothetical protein B0A50_05238 [Salinomyces thailandicus]|uniref:Major facilitator superfamily (MFS) profile domain-containing protein n=1 Tax=Salinomyces thailandicus TaxID=706561 RepID=A0A4U0TXF3_9PEZI|nr:hypothetical protein B0A50_05238 [Salinomyces thailandica]
MTNTSVQLKSITQPQAVADESSIQGTPRTRTTTANVPIVNQELQTNSSERNLTVTSKGRTTVIIASVTLITTISTLLNGLTTVALPTMAHELSIPEGLLLWPTSIQALTTGCTLLISGSLADALGPRLMYLTGSVLQAGMILGCGLSKNATQLILFRGLSGIALSLCLPSVVSIITASFVGKRRNMAFATMGGGQPIGFAIGLVLGGVLTGTIGWRWGFHLSAILDIAIVAVAFWGLPKEIDSPRDADGAFSRSWSQKLARLRSDVDWVGASIASASLAMLSYALAAVTGNTSDIREPSTITVLTIAVALIPAFIWWVGKQEKRGKPALIPNSLWRNKSFTTICLAVFLTWGAFNSLETILTFFFQDVQELNTVLANACCWSGLECLNGWAGAPG